MSGRRLALGVPALALVLAVAGAFSSSSGQAPGQVLGVSYGGLKGVDGVWLRLDGSRNLISAFEIPVAISRDRCSPRKGYFTTVYGGVDNFEPTYLGSDGRFTKRINDRWTYAGTRYEETATVTGAVTDERASGSIKLSVRYVTPKGRVVRCSSASQPWSAVN